MFVAVAEAGRGKPRPYKYMRGGKLCRKCDVRHALACTPSPSFCVVI
jgi:hypothetical protein